MRKRVHVYYSGYVQGVGFRFTAEAIANRLGLTGWVRNLRDGRVELLCEGEEEKLKQYLRMIGEGVLKTYIRNSDIQWDEATDEFSDFSIRF